ncbi:MAG: hypothetical protein ACON46_06065 [Coraliomargaritaceae bacterium]
MGQSYLTIHMNKQRKAIGFPPTLLGEAAIRLPVLDETADWIALNKSTGFGVRAHPWDQVADLDQALNSQLDAAKPELVATQAELFASIYYLEPEVSGVALFAKNRASLDPLRNAYGSNLLRFRFFFIAAQFKDDSEAVLSSDAPLLQHRLKNKMIPSTAKGKKARTDFRCLASSAIGWSLWEATTHYCRLHQIRAHAALLGIPILGDVCYDGPVSPSLRELMPKKRGPGLAAPAFSGLALHLQEVVLPNLGDKDAVTVSADAPKDFRVLMERMGLGGELVQ